MKCFLYIPVVKRFDLLQIACNSMKGVFPESYILNNSGQDIPREIWEPNGFIVITPPKPYGFLKTQNWARKKCIDEKYDYYAFMHNDGENVGDTAIRLREVTEHNIQNRSKIGVVFTHYDVLCTLTRECVEYVLEWGDKDWPGKDEPIHSYHSDNDYYRRIRLAGYMTAVLPNSNVLHHEPSNTINADKEFMAKTNKYNTGEYYAKKWGGHPNLETYIYPFNDPSHYQSSIKLQKNHTSAWTYIVFAIILFCVVLFLWYVFGQDNVTASQPA